MTVVPSLTEVQSPPWEYRFKESQTDADRVQKGPVPYLYSIIHQPPPLPARLLHTGQVPLERL